MALSTVRLLRASALKNVDSVIAAVLLCVYGGLSLTSYFPGFHNHGPVKHQSCCENSSRCTTGDSAALETVVGPSGHEQSHRPCMACLWQAMAKRHIEPVSIAGLFDCFLCTDVSHPADPKLPTPAYRLPETRAPPLS